MNRMVLIADGNTGRGKRLAEACESAGVVCRTGDSGAAALEVALAECPGLVVAQLDLPLVDAVKLAEILRANPRTRGSRFLFIGEGDDRPGGPGDVLLPPGARTDDIVRVIGELVEKQERIARFDEATSAGDVVEGELSLVPLADLLALFQANRKSGRLELERHDEGASDRGLVLIRDGDVIQAETETVTGEKALFRMLGWRIGRFGFKSERLDDPPAIATATRVLLQEGARQLEEWDRQATKLPPLDAQVKLRVATGELPNIVHPLTQEVLLLLELYETVREVVDHCSFPDYQVLRTLHTLADRDLVELGRVPLPVALHGEAEGLFNEAQVRRIREWAAWSDRSGRGTAAPVKLLVAASHAAAIPDFTRLLAGVPGMRLSEEFAAGAPGPDVLAPIGSVEVEPGLSLELIHVPRSERHAPLWPLPGPRSLAPLFLLNGPVGESAARLERACEALAELPRARTFHVVLLRKGERISPDELQENLTLIDEASLFLLPLESDKEPAALLRGLFSRIVP